MPETMSFCPHCLSHQRADAELRAVDRGPKKAFSQRCAEHCGVEKAAGRETETQLQKAVGRCLG